MNEKKNKMPEYSKDTHDKVIQISFWKAIIKQELKNEGYREMFKNENQD